MKRLFTLFFLITISIYGQWIAVRDIPEFKPVLAIYYDGETAIACSDSIIYISNDNGLSWAPSATIGEAGYINTAIKYNNRIFVGSDTLGVFESQDAGKTWFSMDAGISGLGSDYISTLEIRGDSLFAGTMGAGIFVKDLTTSTPWRQYNNGLRSNYSYSVYSLKNINGSLFTGSGISAYYYINHPNSPNWIEYKFEEFNSMTFFDFVEYDNKILMSGDLGLFTSTDSGKTFTFIPHDIGAISTASIEIYGGTIYLTFTKNQGTFWFKSTDSGSSLSLWEVQPGYLVFGTAVIGDKLFAGRNDGLWAYDLSPASVEEDNLPNNFKLLQNYPNPFNPTTNITYSLPKPGIVRITIYDPLGGYIKTILNEYRQAGTHNLKFDAGNLSSGIYFYELTSGNLRETKKMILLR